MNENDSLDERMTSPVMGEKKSVDPSSIVIFGASGDLTARKLIPALYHLFCAEQLPTPFRIVGFARREKSDIEWRAELKEALDKFSRTKPVDEKLWESFSANVFYCQGDFSDSKAYARLEKMLGSFGHEALRRNLLFYLATSPSQFAQVVEELHGAGLLSLEEPEGSWQRIVVEKPFGHDLPSARKLNADLTRFAHERQLFRIDHYLGKERV